ncbi:response regulator [Massilia arenosa]|uniref:Response regulator n=1 Tax=Zemynaea arenosa TaxID=2561931 RepID=A0A4Y9SFQ0_9BURK|nr:response regulator [Massilia arenosa]TFW22374.1 response regulator [Massilia arenosa]
MLKAVIIDSNAVARGLLNTVLTEGGYNVAAMTHTSPLGLALVVKHAPHFVCVALEQVEDGNRIVEQLREQAPKTLIFLVSGALNADVIQQSLARGVHGFIVKPFKADAVLKTIRNTVIAVIKKNQTHKENP